MAQIGRTLREARLERGLTIDDVAQDTRISPRFLQALEEEAFDELPAPVYVRGFLRSYANYLGLRPEPLIEQLHDGIRAPAPGPDSFVAGPAAQRRAGRQPAARSDPFARAEPERRNDPFARRRPADPPPQPAAPPPPPARRYEREDAWGAAADEYDDRYDDDGQYEDDYEEDGYEEQVPALIDGYDETYNERTVTMPGGGRARYRGPGAFGDAPPPRSRLSRSGVLTERETVGGGPDGRVLAIAGVAVFAVLLLIVTVFALNRGGGGDGTTPALGSGETPTRAGGTVIVGGSTQTPDATTTATPVASPSPTESPSATPTKTPTETPTVEPTATPTEVPPTPTPTEPPPPAPTPTPEIIPTGLEECTAIGTCGEPPYTVQCDPNGGRWFIDLPPFFTPEGWYTVYADTTNEAPQACFPG